MIFVPNGNVNGVIFYKENALFYVSNSPELK